MDDFRLEINTPVREFFSGDAEAVTVTCVDGSRTVYAHHETMIAALGIGELRIKSGGAWRDAVHAEGFLEVRPDKVLIFAQSCEWADEIDVSRAEAAKERALEKLRQQQSISEHKQTEISLARAMARLKEAKKSTGNL